MLVHLPSGRTLSVEGRSGTAVSEGARGPELFAAFKDLAARGDLALCDEAGGVDVGSLELRDFHTLRAIATRLGWLAEAGVEVTCRNCDRRLTLAPCALLELGPYLDGELDDPELDRTLPLSTPHPIPEIRLPGGRTARDVTFGPLTVRQAEALHRALGRGRFTPSARIVRAMGIKALGPERAASFVADALSRCSHASWAAIADLFLEAHYPPRLASIAVCRDCGARNDVDAPYDREFDRGIEPRTNQAPFPDFDVFDEAARAAFERIKPAAKGVVLVVEGGVPACDEGGEPLLGSYVPPAGDPTSPMGAGIVTVYYRTFRAAHEEESEYPWESELKETIEHELAHHSGWLTGHDPTDEEERSEIVDERLRVVGRRAVARRVASDFAGDLREFIVRTWPIWLIVALVSVAISVCGQPN